MNDYKIEILANWRCTLVLYLRFKDIGYCFIYEKMHYTIKLSYLIEWVLAILRYKGSKDDTTILFADIRYLLISIIYK
jgi:hypothetical protein